MGSWVFVTPIMHHYLATLISSLTLKKNLGYMIESQINRQQRRLSSQPIYVVVDSSDFFDTKYHERLQSNISCQTTEAERLRSNVGGQIVFCVRTAAVVEQLTSFKRAWSKVCGPTSEVEHRDRMFAVKRTYSLPIQ